MKKIKNLFLQIKPIFMIYEWLFRRKIINYYGRKHTKRALFSYSTYHFKKAFYIAHSNYQESLVTAEILDELGYSIDVVNNNKLTKLSLSNYDLIIGEGLPIFQAVSENISATIIYYATGSHPWQCTDASLARLCEFQRKYGTLPITSTRLQDYRWGIAASLADAVICIGNTTTCSTFEKLGINKIYPLRPSFHFDPFNEILSVKRDTSATRKTALWFGSYGLLHKGLDLTIEAFQMRQDWTLHVCGHTDREIQLLATLTIPKNVQIHGFLDIDSNDFREITSRSLFVILPSCSEGIATSVITAMGRGAMIPLVSKECGIDVKDFGEKIHELTCDGILNTLSVCDSYKDDELKRMSLRAFQTACDDYSLDQYRKNMRNHIETIIL